MFWHRYLGIVAQLPKSGSSCQGPYLNVAFNVPALHQPNYILIIISDVKYPCSPLSSFICHWIKVRIIFSGYRVHGS